MINVWQSTGTWLCKQTGKCCRINTNSSLREGAALVFAITHNKIHTSEQHWITWGVILTKWVSGTYVKCTQMLYLIVSNQSQKDLLWVTNISMGFQKLDLTEYYNNLHVPSSLLEGLLYSGCIWSASRLRGKARWLWERGRGGKKEKWGRPCIQSDIL